MPQARIRSVAASGSVTGALQGQDQKRCSVRECYRSVAGAGSGELQRLGALLELLEERCNVWKSVAGKNEGAGFGAFECPEALQERCRGQAAAWQSQAAALQGQAAALQALAAIYIYV